MDAELNSKNSRRNLYIGLGVGLSVVFLYLAFFGFFFFSMRSGVGRHSSTSEEIANSTKQLVIKPISMYWSTGEKNAMITTIGTIVNSSSFAMESPTIEIRYYNKDHQLIDVIVDAPCDLV